MLRRSRGPSHSLVGRSQTCAQVEGVSNDDLMTKLLDTLPPEQVMSHYGPEQRLAGLAPEQRLAGLAPQQVLSHYPAEQRLAGLDRDHQALALSIELLRVLPDAYVRSLSPEVQAEIRRRLQRDGH